MIELYLIGLIVGLILLFLCIHFAWGFFKTIITTILKTIFKATVSIPIIAILNHYYFTIPVEIPALIVCGLFGLEGLLSLTILDYFHLI